MEKPDDKIADDALPEVSVPEPATTSNASMSELDVSLPAKTASRPLAEIDKSKVPPPLHVVDRGVSAFVEPNVRSTSDTSPPPLPVGNGGVTGAVESLPSVQPIELNGGMVEAPPLDKPTNAVEIDHTPPPLSAHVRESMDRNLGRINMQRSRRGLPPLPELPSETRRKQKQQFEFQGTDPVKGGDWPSVSIGASGVELSGPQAAQQQSGADADWKAGVDSKLQEILDILKDIQSNSGAARLG